MRKIFALFAVLLLAAGCAADSGSQATSSDDPLAVQNTGAQNYGAPVIRVPGTSTTVY